MKSVDKNFRPQSLMLILRVRRSTWMKKNTEIYVFESRRDFALSPKSAALMTEPASELNFMPPCQTQEEDPLPVVRREGVRANYTAPNRSIYEYSARNSFFSKIFSLGFPGFILLHPTTEKSALLENYKPLPTFDGRFLKMSIGNYPIIFATFRSWYCLVGLRYLL